MQFHRLKKRFARFRENVAVAPVRFCTRFFLPHERPAISALKALGFSGNNDAAILSAVFKRAPELLSKYSSASAMWVANAATVTPFFDTDDGKTHITPANLISHLHRAIETSTTAKILKKIFCCDDFMHHPPLSLESCCQMRGQPIMRVFAPIMISRA